MTTAYPDISDLLRMKAQARRKRAGLSFAEKIEWVEKARRDLATFDRLRRARRDRSGSPATYAREGT